ncbi:MAG: hypothetical protein HY744_04520 [Deltaproteobacteria bacterium]|nr:hypothetical protein [Deltaproteobacteria bacterium]
MKVLGAGVVQVAANRDDGCSEVHTCARKADGTLWCWGSNEKGQLGDGTTKGQDCNGWPCKPSPQQVPALGTSVVEVSAGEGHTCARTGSQKLWCWGNNAGGQLGSGTVLPELSPVPVTALGASVVEVSAGYNHTCARKGDGTLWCWGSNGSGQLGDGTTKGQDCSGWCNALPVQVTALGTAVVEVSAGYNHTCARKQSGTVWCWGKNQLGQLGDGTTIDRPTPVQAHLTCQ